ncbi:flagellar basal body-associated FliL family protein [Alphaproteobacteria bacterium]|nr:flagellar basal body-associated FliL family protein [Alphaproteobacteria bacterium]
MFKFNNKKLLILVAIASSIITFIFFIISKNMMVEEKLVLEEINVYKIAKEEAIKLGRLEPDEKEIIKNIGADGKVIVPSISYADIGGMGPNSNKSFATNISNSKSFVSFDIAFSSYEGEDLTTYLTDYDSDFRKIIYNQIAKREVAEFEGSKGRKSLLEDIKNEFNAYLDKKELDPVVFGAHFKVFSINHR